MRNGFDIEKLRGKRGRATTRRLRKIAKICKTTYTLLRRSSELRTYFVTQFPTAADGVVVHQSQYALVEDFHRFFFVSYLNISDNAFDIGRSLVQLFLMRLEIFPEVGRIYQAIGKLQGEEPHLLGGVATQGRGGGGG